jgi:hypothetical protein
MNMIAANSIPMSPAMYSSDNSLPFAMMQPTSLGTASQSESHGLSESHSLFAQLRNRYPAGALVSELVQVHDGQFVVRVLVQVGTTTLATAMAAAAQVEEAEDRARVRAMAVLGISPTIGISAPPVVSSTVDVQTPFKAEPLAVEPLEESPPSDPILLPESALPQIEEKGLEPVDAKKPSRRKKEKEETPPELDLLSFSGLEDTALDVAEVPPSPESAELEYFGDTDAGEVDYGSSEVGYTEEPIQAAFVASEPMKAIVPDMSTEPIDLSDAIAQIGTEIERIGWTKKQGSTYLQQTYSKKTRAELTEDELLEFLHYLKALPSKGHPSLSQLPF